MNPPHRLTTESIRELAASPGPWMTLVLENPAELKQTLQSARRQCAERGIDPEPLVESVADAVQSLNREAKQHGTTIVLRSPAVMLTGRAGSAVRPVISVGEEFN